MRKFLYIILAIAALIIYVDASCNSCGSICATECGSRYFRLCCYRFLVKKRSEEVEKNDVSGARLELSMRVLPLESAQDYEKTNLEAIEMPKLIENGNSIEYILERKTN